MCNDAAVETLPMIISTIAALLFGIGVKIFIILMMMKDDMSAIFMRATTRNGVLLIQPSLPTNIQQPRRRDSIIIPSGHSSCIVFASLTQYLLFGDHGK